MDNIIDIAFSLCILLLVLFTVSVWSFEILAILRSRKEQDRFRKNPWFSGLAFLASPAIILLHICAHLLKKLSHVLRFFLVSILILLALLVSPAFILVVPLAFLVFKLYQVAAPLGGRIFHLSLDFFDQLNFWFGEQKQERLS